MITPLSQGAITTLGVLGMAGNSPFREAVDQVLSIKNFKDKSEWEAAVQDLFGGKRSPFVSMYELFLSRTEYGSTDYEEVEDEDPHLKKFIETEDRCKYRNVYPFLEDYETAYDHFSYPRPLVLRRYLNSMKSWLGRHYEGRTLVFLPETYDLILPTNIRPIYYRRLRASVVPFLSSGHIQVILPSQLSFVQREIDQALEREGRISEANSEGDRGEGEAEEGPPEIASDDVIKGTLQINYRFATRFALQVVRELGRSAKKMFERLSSEYKNDPRGFIRSVHSFMESIVYSSAMNPTFVPVFVVDRQPAEPDDRYRAKLIVTLLAFRHYVMVVDPIYTGLSSSHVIRSSLGGKSPVPALSGSSQFLIKEIENNLVRNVVSEIASKAGMLPPRVSLQKQVPFFSRIASSSVFDKGVISVLSGPRHGGGVITVQTIPISIDSSSFDRKFVSAVLEYADKPLEQNMASLEATAANAFMKFKGSLEEVLGK
jgi:hypothetical protein